VGAKALDDFGSIGVLDRALSVIAEGRLLPRRRMVERTSGSLTARGWKWARSVQVIARGASWRRCQGSDPRSEGVGLPDNDDDESGSRRTRSNFED